MHTYIHTYTYIHTHPYIHIHIHTYMHAYIHRYIGTCTFHTSCIYVYTYAYNEIYTYVYIVFIESPRHLQEKRGWGPAAFGRDVFGHTNPRLLTTASTFVWSRVTLYLGSLPFRTATRQRALDPRLRVLWPDFGDSTGLAFITGVRWAGLADPEFAGPLNLDLP